MSEWKARRFWTAATVEEVAGGYTVRLDGRPVKSPSKTELIMPSRALAGGVAAEWDAQAEVIDPLSMPLTRAVNSTLDKVMPQAEAVAAHLAEYGGSDLLSYRAAGPAELVARQCAAWDPMLDWAAEALGARLAVTEGVMPAAQPANATEALHARVAALSAWELTALSEFVTLSGSLVLGLAAMAEQDIETLWRASRIDEDWQIEQWGPDEEEQKLTASRRAAFLQAARYLELLRAG
ncbi:ATP12 family chaperone protein [Jannaschia ovalis]|uniref:ATP12 family protein n=1 Tax=Jannaschia ovalis TaxID=3038773 RepID=A0ABY8LCR6_9RHOB|nr:ATP12 family protein [Jannaschia sp. GRR-S6-38]WGH79122.1 ATP12 family protein [Jannaschia sp. GRR-S6-38]